MKRFEGRVYKDQWYFLPAIGLIDRQQISGEYRYKYRVAFAWLCFYGSIGIVKTKEVTNA